MTAPLALDELKKLLQKKYRDEHRFFLAEGEHLVLELAKAAAGNPGLATAEVLISGEYESRSPLGAWARQLTVRRVGEKQIASLSDTRSPQGIIAVVPILAPAPAAAGEKAIYLHEIQDPGNLGTILRTLAWFGNFRCLLSPNSVDPYNPKVVRASMGAIFHVPIETDVLPESLIARYPKLAVLDTEGAPLSAQEFRAFDAYVFGNEARGLPPALLAQLQPTVFTIPGGKRIESLNLAAAVNITLYELTR